MISINTLCDSKHTI